MNQRPYRASQTFRTGRVKRAVTSVSTIPSEDDEQIRFRQWLDQVKLMYTAIPNHTYNPHPSQQLKNRNLGLRKGFPDIVVLVPHWMSKDGRGHFLALEMKRTKGSSTSADQKLWIAALNMLGAAGVEAHICKGADEAISAVCRYIHPETAISPF